MKVAHFNAWDTTVCQYFQAVRSSSRKGGCGDVYFTKLLQEKHEVSMHQFYSSVGVELMLRSVARILLPLAGDGPHWIVQDTTWKCYHFNQVQVLKMYNNIFGYGAE
jgi:hypothetical protein